MYSVTLEQFEGPLDLLLKLCQDEKCAISEISLAKIADAYLQEISSATTIAPGELADFLVVAAQLLLIKSRLLLPQFALTDEEEPVPDLERKLKIYKEYVQAMGPLHDLVARKHFLYSREGLPVGWEKILAEKAVFTLRTEITPNILHGFLVTLIANLEKIQVKLPQEAIRKVASLEEKIKQLQAFLVGRTHSSFHDAVPKTAPKIDIILHFLAMLELAKQQYVVVEQQEVWGEITLTKQEQPTTQQ